MWRLVICCIVFGGFSKFSFSQVGIGTTTPNSSSILDVSSTSKGLLIPRLTQTQINAMTGLSAGMQVYNTTEGALTTYDGSRWLFEKRYNAGFIALGDTITLGNVMVKIPSSGNKSIQIALKGGNVSLTGSSLNNFQNSAAAATGSLTAFVVWGVMLETYGTTFKYWQSGADFLKEGSWQEIHFIDETNGKMYFVRFIKGSSTSNNYVELEQLL